MTSTHGTAVVTGGGRGIGRAIAHRLHDDGYDVLVVDRDEKTARLVADEVHGRSQAIDVTDAEAMATLSDLAPECTALVSNAALTLYTPLLETPVDQARLVFDINVIGQLTGAQALAPVIAANGGGSIVNLSSITARSHPPSTGMYSPSKAAVEQLTRALALELGPSGVRVNAVAPGSVPTEGADEHYGEDDALSRRAGVLPLRRLGHIDDISSAVSWFCSAESSYVTGQILAVDGGFLVSNGQFFRLARGDR
jgi:NAD(P)-dependent dehydrogenase (short-subunit alcohol dehydrogenase family)